MGQGVRPDGWETHLNSVLAAATVRRYAAKEWNCARFAHACAEAVSGRTLPFRRRGTLEESVDAVLPRSEPRQARRGDVVLAEVPEPSLGVCLGRKAAFVTARGLLTVPMRSVRVAWSV